MWLYSRTVAIFLVIGLILTAISCGWMTLALPKQDNTTGAAALAIETLRAQKSENDALKAQAEALPRAIREQGIADVNLTIARANAQADLILARTQSYVVTWELRQRAARAHYWQLLIAIAALAALCVLVALAFAEYDRRTRPRTQNP